MTIFVIFTPKFILLVLIGEGIPVSMHKICPYEKIAISSSSELFPYLDLYLAYPSRKHAHIILTPLNPTFIW